jgi:hypothetical protein
MLLPLDGAYEIYRIQEYDNRAKEWFYPSQDDGHLVNKVPNHLLYDGSYSDGKYKSPWRDFGANGACWQKTCIFGVFELDKAMDYMKILATNNPGIKLRVIKVKISQETLEIATMQVPEK